jgi:hypothetical protein
MKKLILALATAATLVLPAAADAQRGGWRIIGFKTVGAGTDRDTIRVRGRERFRQVQLCSLNRPIRMMDFDVVFANGGRQDVQVRQRIAPGACTRAIDLKGQARDIARIELAYGRLERGVRTPVIQVRAR